MLSENKRIRKNLKGRLKKKNGEKERIMDYGRDEVKIF